MMMVNLCYIESGDLPGQKINVAKRRHGKISYEKGFLLCLTTDHNAIIVICLITVFDHSIIRWKILLLTDKLLGYGFYILCISWDAHKGDIKMRNEMFI